MRTMPIAEGRMAMAFVAAVAAFAWWGTLAAQEEAPARPDDAEARLLRAELLEVSTGDLERAMEVYRELADAEGASDEVRARALLYLGRAHRKRGELEKAREVFEDVLENHAREREVVRRAWSFLAELREGRATERRFDWLGELRKNPEVQARIFDYIMDLVEPDKKAQVAARQLLTLGAIAVPMLEESIERSRDLAHRERIALLLANLGSYERLGLAPKTVHVKDLPALEARELLLEPLPLPQAEEKEVPRRKRLRGAHLAERRDEPRALLVPHRLCPVDEVRKVSPVPRARPQHPLERAPDPATGLEASSRGRTPRRSSASS